ncbi:MAG: hypothetical protein LBJ57_03090 [Prevotellaceae bacterium]|jgi:hypothetical protein|nr:hypothetical protein [Prevotellaceae bacterium]
MNVPLTFFAAIACCAAATAALALCLGRGSALQKKKAASGVAISLEEVFGTSQAVAIFLPTADGNNRQNDNADDENDGIEFVALEADEFDVAYGDDDVGTDFSSAPPDSLTEEEHKNDMAAQGLLFGDIQQAVKAIETLSAGMEDSAPAQQARRVFRMLDETELLDKMRRIKPAVSAQLEALMDIA